MGILEFIYQFYSSTDLLWILYGVVILIALAWLFHNPMRRRPRGPAFSPKQREHLEGVILESIESAVFLGIMSRNRARYWYSRFGKEFGLTGLLPPKRWKMLHPHKAAALKTRIKETLKNGEHRPVPLPPQPVKGEVTRKKPKYQSKSAKLDAIFAGH